MRPQEERSGRTVGYRYDYQYGQTYGRSKGMPTHAGLQVIGIYCHEGLQAAAAAYVV